MRKFISFLMIAFVVFIGQVSGAKSQQQTFVPPDVGISLIVCDVDVTVNNLIYSVATGITGLQFGLVNRCGSSPDLKVIDLSGTIPLNLIPSAILPIKTICQCNIKYGLKRLCSEIPSTYYVAIDNGQLTLIYEPDWPTGSFPASV